MREGGPLGGAACRVQYGPFVPIHPRRGDFRRFEKQNPMGPLCICRPGGGAGHPQTPRHLVRFVPTQKGGGSCRFLPGIGEGKRVHTPAVTSRLPTQNEGSVYSIVGPGPRLRVWGGRRYVQRGEGLEPPLQFPANGAIARTRVYTKKGQTELGPKHQWAPMLFMEEGQRLASCVDGQPPPPPTAENAGGPSGQKIPNDARTSPIYTGRPKKRGLASGMQSACPS